MSNRNENRPRRGHTVKLTWVLAFCWLSLSACGGGGSDGGTQPPSGTPQNQLPTADAGADQSVDEGATVNLTGTGTDSDGSIISYEWQQDSGTATSIFNSDRENASFTAPEVAATEDLVFRLTVTDNDGATATDIVTITVRDVPAITINVLEPRASALVGAELRVSATVSSTLEIAQVRAIVVDRESQLVYSADSGRFEGIVPLEGLARGAQTLEVVAEDVAGEEARSLQTFVFDKKPELTVLAPVEDTVATPLLRVTADCVDDDPAGCELVVSDPERNEIFRSRDAIDTEVDLSAYDGRAIAIRIQAIDSADQVTEVSRRIYVEASTVLSEVFTVSGLILDVQGERLLRQIAADSGDRLDVINWRSGTTDPVSLPIGKRVSPKHFLTPYGAIFVTQDVGGNVRSSRVFDWNQGTLEDLGSPNSASSLAVAGDFAIWNTDDDGYGVTLTRRNLAGRSNLVVSIDAGNWSNGVAANGTVAYWTTDYQIEVYSDGAVSVLTDDVDLWNTYVLTDGTRAVYRKHTPCCNDQTYAIVLHDGVEELVLRDAQQLEPYPGRDYQIVSGWVSYTDVGNLGQRHVWLLDPTGQRQQLTFFGESSTIDALGDNGEVILLSGEKRYLATPEGELTEVGSSSGKAYWIDGRWYVAIGGSLFRVLL